MEIHTFLKDHKPQKWLEGRFIIEKKEEESRNKPVGIIPGV